MRHRFFCAAALSCAAAGLLFACGDDDVFQAPRDAGAEAGPRLEAGPGPSGDGGGGDGGDAAAPPSVRLLLSMNHLSTSELVALDLETGAVSGRLTYQGGLGSTSAAGAQPWLAQSATDLVTLLDEREPWRPVSSWSVKGADRPDGSLPNANPVTIVSAGTKAYVVRFNRNAMHVLDTTQRVEAGAPTKTIDLSPLLQGADLDGRLEPTSAVYVPSKRRVFVLLGNVDFTKIAADGFTALCAATKPSIVGIDVDTDQVVSLGGAGPMGSILLEGYNPPIGTALHYDAAKDRLVVLSAGCNTDAGGGAAGPIERRRVEEVALSGGAVKTLVSLDGKPFPSSLAFVDGTRAGLAFFGPASFWDPSSTALGADFPGGAENLAHDGKGALVGVRKLSLPDGGATVEIVKAPFGADAGAEAGATPVARDPFLDNTGFLSGAELWVR